MHIELFNYFTTDNISGKKCTEKWLCKNNKELFEKIIEWCNNVDKLNNLEFKRKVYHYVNKLKEIPSCNYCKKDNMKYHNFRYGYNSYCNDKCVKSSDEYYNKWLTSLKENNTNDKILEKRKETAIKNYGSYDNYKKVLLETRKKNTQEQYGVEYLFLTDNFKENRKISLKERYGDDKWNNKEKTRNTRIFNKTQINDSEILGLKDYKKIAINRTITIYRNNINLINPNNLKRGMWDYHIDHKFSLKQGFLNNLPLEIISHPCNLRMLWHVDNLKKQDMCFITLDELLNDIMKYEYEIKIIHSSLNESYNKEYLIEICKQILKNLNLNKND